MGSKYLDAVVLARRPLTERIAEFLIGAADGSRLPPAEAGSHVELRFGGADGCFLRHYSVVGPLGTADCPEPFWRVAVQREDRSRGSAFIHERFRAGTPLRVSRPLNAFRLGRGQPHTLLVAGGIGVTPILAMARALRVRRASFSVLYAGRDRSEMAYLATLEELCGERLAVHESRRDGTPDLLRLLAGQLPGTLAHVCGPPAMIEALRDAAASLGWAPDRVRSEVFNAAHRPEDTGFAVRLLSTGQTLAVAAGTTILDALEAAGIDTLSDCRRGECGLCLTEVAGCDGPLDHRDRFLDDAERAEGRQIAICCSRVAGRVLDLAL